MLQVLKTKVYAASHFKETVIPKRSKAEKGGAKSVDTSSGKLWEVELYDTVIFPEGEPLRGFALTNRRRSAC